MKTTIMKKLLMMAICLSVGIAGSAGTVAADTHKLQVQVVCPAKITNNVQFNITLNLRNNNPSGGAAITFDKIAILYVNPDLTVKGPYEVSAVSRTVNANSSLNITVPFKISTRQTAGGFVPVVVSLYQGSYAQGSGNGRGSGNGNTKVAGWLR
jgi:hypothetical protein